MTNIPIFDELSFHDSGLERISVEGSTVEMVFEGVGYERLVTEQDDWPLVSLTLWVERVTSIVENDQPVQQLAIQGSYGSVIQFERTEQGFSLAVSWCHFGPGARDGFSAIKLSGPDLKVRCGPYTYQQPEGQ